MKFMIASHGNYAEGLATAIEQLNGKNENLFVINAYLTEETLESQVRQVVERFEDEEWVIFTDLLGGSVNQYMMKNLMRENIRVVTGINLYCILEILQQDEKKISDDFIKEIVELSKSQLVYVNELLEDELKSKSNAK